MGAGALIAIAFVHNLLRRHPACGVLLHRLPRPAPDAASPDPKAINSTSAHHDTNGWSSEGAKAAAEEAPGVDVYSDTAADPAHSRAIESSLWELDSMRNHYCPQVTAMGRVCVTLGMCGYACPIMTCSINEMQPLGVKPLQLIVAAAGMANARLSDLPDCSNQRFHTCLH